MKADLEAAVRVTLINLVVALDPTLAFRISTAGMDDGPGAALTSPTMKHIRSFGLTRCDYPKERQWHCAVLSIVSLPEAVVDLRHFRHSCGAGRVAKIRHLAVIFSESTQDRARH